jgi:hypothetical protein
VIVSDLDEGLYHPDLKGLLSQTSEDIINLLGIKWSPENSYLGKKPRWECIVRHMSIGVGILKSVPALGQIESIV